MTKRSTLPTSVLPAAYEVWRTSQFGQITDRIEEELILRMIGPIQGKRVLDVGCGDGVLSVRFALKGAHVTGLDADPGMIAAARDRENSAHPSVTYVEGNTGSLADC
jgi:2-polyprenyl-3-methyl-5-hydroxy-6-metoxy-1,4-benzoquinol methylase